MDRETPSPTDRMFQIISGFWTSRAVYVAAKLGIADLVHDRPRTAAELAEATGTHAPSLFRVPRWSVIESERGRIDARVFTRRRGS